MAVEAWFTREDGTNASYVKCIAKVNKHRPAPLLCNLRYTRRKIKTVSKPQYKPDFQPLKTRINRVYKFGFVFTYNYIQDKVEKKD